MAVVLVGLLVTSCQRGPAGPPPAGSPGAITPPAASVTDIAWAQLIIAMDERTVAVLTLVPVRATDAGLVAFARDLQTAQRWEVGRIQAELDRLGVTGENVHTRHDMPGMPTAATVAELGTATGATFDRLAVEALRRHLDQCLTLVAGELVSGVDPAMRLLALGVDAARRTQLESLDRLVGD